MLFLLSTTLLFSPFSSDDNTNWLSVPSSSSCLILILFIRSDMRLSMSTALELLVTCKAFRVHNSRLLKAPVPRSRPYIPFTEHHLNSYCQSAFTSDMKRARTTHTHTHTLQYINLDQA